ncbi:hypothetical protein ACODG4_03450 [Vagococcus fluvialis]|uniref:hypothetical protein n=1 Tax=Vagococcus fluvialis TaxID=2738 RepID=UPI001A8FC627|nr:hypothetical protein [Vagococcus fluvialis]MBO0479302.1 hypothetical protein [Vagococcus fluvialis]MBO0485160.1 hypothetical protein [Vagococcus fluvialis]
MSNKIKLKDFLTSINSSQLKKNIPINGSITFGIKEGKLSFVKYRQSNRIEQLFKQEENNG